MPEQPRRDDSEDDGDQGGARGAIARRRSWAARASNPDLRTGETPRHYGAGLPRGSRSSRAPGAQIQHRVQAEIERGSRFAGERLFEREPGLPRSAGCVVLSLLDLAQCVRAQLLDLEAELSRSVAQLANRLAFSHSPLTSRSPSRLTIAARSRATAYPLPLEPQTGSDRSPNVPGIAGQEHSSARANDVAHLGYRPRQSRTCSRTCVLTTTSKPSWPNSTVRASALVL